MHEDVYRCLSLACQRARVRGADGTALRFVCASTVPSPHSRGPTHRMDRYSYTVYAHALPRTPIVVRAYRRGGHAPRTRPCVRACVRALVCVCALARPHPRRRVRALPAAAERRVNRLAGVLRGVGLQREHRRVEHRLRHDVVRGMRRSRPGAHRGGLRPVVVRVADVRVRVHVAMCIRLYVDGPPLDTHLCSSAIELPLHQRLSMSNAHMHRPFPRCMYT